MKKYLLAFLFLIISSVSQAQLTTSLTVTGSDWSVNTLSSASTITKAGKNYESAASESSSLSQTYIKVSAILAWQINVQLSSTANWDPALKISVLRTGDGMGGARITGGNTTFQQVTTGVQPFFNGTLVLVTLGFGRENIPVQYKIEGLSVLLPVKTYSTTILYTVTGL